jgi:hypothetical protein
MKIDYCIEVRGDELSGADGFDGINMYSVAAPDNTDGDERGKL